MLHEWDYYYKEDFIDKIKYKGIQRGKLWYEKIMESSPVVKSQSWVQHALSIEMKHSKIELKSKKYEQFKSKIELKYTHLYNWVSRWWY